MWATQANPSVRWVQLTQAAVLTSFIGAMWGLERALVPLIAQQDFHITSTTVTLSFIVGFGIAKTFANLFAGGLMDRVGRKRVLVIGWIAGLPVPFLIIWAPQWEWIIAANILLGVNQGFCWTATILIMMDIMGERFRGLSAGLNEFVGYSGVAVAALVAGVIASTFSPRPYPFILGIGLASLGLLMSVLFVRDSRHYIQIEPENALHVHQPDRFWTTFLLSLKNRTLFSCNQAGLVTKINDATVWGLFPLFLASEGLDITKISIVAAVYPQVWGISQLATGFLSDHFGRKPLIVVGMSLQGIAIALASFVAGFPLWIVVAAVLGIGTAAVYPTLIAAVGDQVHPVRRASAIGTYRWYRDSGFIIGGILAGILADLQGFKFTFLVVGGINILSAIVIVRLMSGQFNRLKQSNRVPSE